MAYISLIKDGIELVIAICSNAEVAQKMLSTSAFSALAKIIPLELKLEQSAWIVEYGSITYDIFATRDEARKFINGYEYTGTPRYVGTMRRIPTDAWLV